MAHLLGRALEELAAPEAEEGVAREQGRAGREVEADVPWATVR